MPQASAGASFVDSPIPSEAAKKMSDNQWIGAMREYPETDFTGRSKRGFLVGGGLELSRQLEAEARENKERFATLALKLDKNTPIIYLEALLRALVAKHDDSQGGAKARQVLPELPSEILFPVFRHIHQIPGHPCGRWLCSGIGAVADRELPDDILEILCFYASEDRNPETIGEPEMVYFGGDLVTYGINTTRGAAADALANVLFGNKKRWKKIEKGVRSVVHDRSWSVRAVAISTLTALLTVDRSLAVPLFLKTVREAPPVLGSLFVGRFLYYALFLTTALFGSFY